MKENHSEKSQDKLVTIIMSVFNESIDYIKKSVKSIQEQTYKNIEFIIIIDNPEIDEKIIDFLKFIQKNDNRIMIIKNEKNIGLAKSLNKGLAISKGDLIARMDADDISKTNRIEEEVKIINFNDYDMVFSLVEKIDDEDKVWDNPSEIPNDKRFIKEILPLQNIVVHPTIMIKSKVMKELNGYRPFPTCQDYDLWLRMLSEDYKIGVINKSLLSFRRHPNSITATKHYFQYICEKLIRELYFERIKKGKDSYTEEKMNNYFKNEGISNNKIVSFENEKYKKYRESIKDFKRKKTIKSFLNIIDSMRAKCVRSSLKTSLKARKIRKKYL